MYLFLATVNVSNFVTVKLSANKESNNYSSWKVQVLSLVESHDLMGFIDGTIKIPLKPPTETPDDDAIDGASKSGKAYNKWRTDKLVRGWILGAISEPGLLVKAANHSSARKVWLDLEMKFDKQTGLVPRTTKSAESQNIPKDMFNTKTPLIQAALDGNWDAAQQLLGLDRDLDEALTWVYDGKTVSLLEVAVGTGKAIPFVNKLLDRIPEGKSIAMRNHTGATALHTAAAVGNEEAAKLLFNRDPTLCYIPNRWGNFPIHSAAQYAKRNTLKYLISVTRDDQDSNPYASTSGLRLLLSTIDAEFFDIAIDLVEKYPYLAGERIPASGETALAHITKRSVLSNKRRFGFLERFLSSLVPATPTSMTNELNDIEKGSRDSEHKQGVCQKLNIVVWKILEPIVPHIRSIKEKTKANEEALKLVRLLCDKIKSLDDLECKTQIYDNAILTAATLGVSYVVEEIMEKFPLSIYARQYPAKHSIFHIAIENRSEDVFNLIHQMSDHKYMVSNVRDSDWNNILHLAGKLAPSHKLNEISGAALQMQRELQWYKEVEKLVHPSAKEQINEDGKTPQMVFTEEHENLKEDGEKWMKDTATSYTISAGLIATVMFAAAITVPGGNDGNNGLPIFSQQRAFIIFAVSVAISLFASTTSLLLFLGVLTSRYAEEDFLRSLPKRLIFGLATLFLSITFMMVSFAATLFLVFGKNKLWVLFSVLILACLPITSFVIVQFHLLVDLISSTYCRGIFGKKSDRPFY